jgi:hypothetical protein
MTIAGTGFFVSGASRLFDWEFQVGVQHPAADFEVVFTNDVLTPLEATRAQTRAAIVFQKQVQDLVSSIVPLNVDPQCRRSASRSFCSSPLAAPAFRSRRRLTFAGWRTRRDQPRRIHRLSNTWCCHRRTDHSPLCRLGDRSITSPCGEHRRHRHLEQASGSAVPEM